VLLSTLGLFFYGASVLPKRKRDQENESLRVFCRAIELRFPGQKGISERLVSLSMATGQELKLNSEDIRLVEMAALVRDIGLCAVPWKMLNRHQLEGWTAAEFATYDQRLIAGAAMLEKIPTLRHLAQTVRAIYQLSPSIGEPSRHSVPVPSMILGVVDRYLQIERLQGAEPARDMLNKESGSRYDPKVVEALFRVLPQYNANEKVEAFI